MLDREIEMSVSEYSMYIKDVINPKPHEDSSTYDIPFSQDIRRSGTRPRQVQANKLS